MSTSIPTAPAPAAVPAPPDPPLAPTVPGDPTDVLGRRLVAWVIDSVPVAILTIVLAVATVSTASVDDLDNPCTDGEDACAVDDTLYFYDADARSAFTVEVGGLWVPSLVLLAYGVGVLVVWQGRTGRTVGKSVMGLRCVDERGRPPGIGRAFMRYVVWAVDAFPLGLPVIGGVVAARSSGHRRVGDLVASTYVVDAIAAGRAVTTGNTPADPVGRHAQDTAVTPVGPWPAPVWDAARGAYLVWDPVGRSWLRYEGRAWVPLLR